MRIICVYKQALRKAWGSSRLLAMLYCFNILLGFPAAYAFRATLQDGFGRSLAPERLLPGFDYMVFSDFLNHHGRAVDAILRVVIALIVLAVIVGPFLSGATIAAVRAKESRVSVRTFFRDGGLYYGRMFRLVLLFGLAIFLLLGAGGTILESIVSTVDDEAVSEVSTIVAFLAGVGVIGLLVVILFVALEFSRISAVAGNSRRMVPAAVSGIGFALRNIGRIAGLLVLFSATFGVLVTGYWWLEGILPADTAPIIGLLFLVQQFFILFRIALRIAIIAGENLIFEQRKPEPVLFYGWDDSPAPVL